MKKTKKNRGAATPPKEKNTTVVRRKFWLLVVNLFLLFSLYQLFLYFEWIWGTGLYLIAAAVLAVAYYLLNRGFGKPIADGDALPDDWSPAKKCAYIEDAQRRHERAGYLLLWLLPLVITLLFDVLSLFLLTPLREMLGI